MIESVVAATLGDGVALVVADETTTLAAVIEQLRGCCAARPEAILLVVTAGVAALDRALLRAALGPLAVAFAPAVRINALDVARQADQDDVVAAARYLAGAASTTGQWLEIAC